MNCFVLYSVYTILFVKSVSNSRGHYLLTQSLVKGCPIFSNSNDFVNSLLFFLEFSSLTCYLYRSFTDMIPPFAYSNLNHDLCLSATVWNNESPVAQRDVAVKQVAFVSVLFSTVIILLLASLSIGSVLISQGSHRMA